MVVTTSLGVITELTHLITLINQLFLTWGML